MGHNALTLNEDLVHAIIGGVFGSITEIDLVTNSHL